MQQDVPPAIWLQGLGVNSCCFGLPSFNDMMPLQWQSSYEVQVRDIGNSFFITSLKYILFPFTGLSWFRTGTRSCLSRAGPAVILYFFWPDLIMCVVHLNSIFYYVGNIPAQHNITTANKLSLLSPVIIGEATQNCICKWKTRFVSQDNWDRYGVSNMLYTYCESPGSEPELTAEHRVWLCVYSENLISSESILHLVEAHKAQAVKGALWSSVLLLSPSPFFCMSSLKHLDFTSSPFSFLLCVISFLCSALIVFSSSISHFCASLIKLQSVLNERTLPICPTTHNFLFLPWFFSFFITYSFLLPYILLSSLAL